MAKCGTCKQKMSTEEYLVHTCKTGYTPVHVEHQDALTGGRFSKVAAKALERGQAKQAEVEQTT